MSQRSGTLQHTADLGLWVEADDLPSLYAGAVEALSRLMTHGSRQGEPAWLEVDLTGQDRADLLVQLLNEVVYQLDAQRLLSTALELDELGPLRLRGRLGVIPLCGRHHPGEPVKAVTYHQASVRQISDGWRGEVILDV